MASIINEMNWNIPVAWDLFDDFVIWILLILQVQKIDIFYGGGSWSLVFFYLYKLCMYWKKKQIYIIKNKTFMIKSNWKRWKKGNNQYLL